MKNAEGRVNSELRTPNTEHRMSFPLKQHVGINGSAAVLKASRSSIERAAAGLRHSRAPVQDEMRESND